MLSFQCSLPLPLSLQVYAFRSARTSPLILRQKSWVLLENLARRRPAHSTAQIFSSPNIVLSSAPVMANEDNQKSPPSRSLGKYQLLLVPVFWSSYSFLLKVLYSLPWAVPASLFNLLRLTIACTFLLRSIRFDKKSLIAGCELGFYTTFINVLQIIGYKHTSASQGAFLSQLSAVLVPIVSVILGMEADLPWNVMAAVPLSLSGVGLLTLSGGLNSLNLNGDGMLLLVACVGTVYTIRAKQYSKENVIRLVAMKNLFQVFFSLAYFLWNRPSLAGFFVGATPMLVFYNALVILWAAVTIGFLGPLLQISGQKLVTPTQASVVFASTPLWATLWALPLGERLSPRGWAGATLIICATLLASVVRKVKEKTV